MAAEGTGRVEAIWLKRAKGGPMDAVSAAELVPERGLVGNANQGGRRQVTIIARETWRELMAELDGDVSPSARRANLMVSGLDLERTRGRRLQVGDTLLEIAGETRPCEQMDAALPGLRRAMQERWRGGVFAMVLQGGEIRVGDPVILSEAPPVAES